jgi:hypothetical protein
MTAAALRIVAISTDLLAGIDPNAVKPFPDLESFQYAIALKPDRARLGAWPKLEETERRLTVLRWVVSVTDPSRSQYHVLLDDSETAFLLAFEATLQLVKDQFIVEKVQPQFDQWLPVAQKGRDDLIFRGIRTLRHLEAHVRAELTHSKIVFHPREPNQPRVTLQWQLPPLTAATLGRLKHPRLNASELEQWNAIVRDTAIETLMQQALEELGSVVEAAERQLVGNPAAQPGPLASGT